MRMAMIVGGVLLLMVGLGFVCPQLAQVRGGGELGVGHAMLLGGGVLASLAGIVVGTCGVTGRTSFASRP